MESLFLAFQVYGLAIVVSMAVALMIKGIVSVLARVKAPRQEIPESPASGREVTSIPEAHLAAIAAAAYTATGAHHILHVEDRSRGMAWTFEGRVAHHASHAVPRRPAR